MKTLTMNVSCFPCRGTGVVGENDCSVCVGTGRVPAEGPRGFEALVFGVAVFLAFILLALGDRASDQTVSYGDGKRLSQTYTPTRGPVASSPTEAPVNVGPLKSSSSGRGGTYGH